MTELTMNLPTAYELDPLGEHAADFPEYADDHILWMALLSEAYHRDLDTFGALHGLRCGGALLAEDKDFGMLIKPGSWEKSKYDAFRAQHLTPRKELVINLLKTAAKALDELTVTVPAAQYSAPLKKAASSQSPLITAT